MKPASIPAFSARVVPGVQRGRTLGTPTINLDLRDIPEKLPHGIYACFAQLGNGVETLPAVMHYGPRPVFKDSVSCEVHILDRMIDVPPQRLAVSAVEFIREITDFPIKEVLLEQIQSDIAVARDILGSRCKQEASSVS